MQLQIRCYDVDAKTTRCGSSVRLSASAEIDRPHPLRVLSPNDEIGALLFLLSFPTVIGHHMMPITSCIHPPRYITTTATVHPAGLDLRQVDSLVASREEIGPYVRVW
jgi:hypothetical protein